MYYKIPSLYETYHFYHGSNSKVVYNIVSKKKINLNKYFQLNLQSSCLKLWNLWFEIKKQNNWKDWLEKFHWRWLNTNI